MRARAMQRQVGRRRAGWGPRTSPIRPLQMLASARRRAGWGPRTSPIRPLQVLAEARRRAGWGPRTSPIRPLQTLASARPPRVFPVLLGAFALLVLAVGYPLGQVAEGVWRAEMPPEETHPCLMFGPDEIPAMRERLEREPYSRWWAGVQRSGNMVAQAFTWCMTGDAEKAEAVRQGLLRADPTGHHCSCGVATALQGCAEAYDLIYHYEGLTPEEHRIIRAKIANSCERLYLSALQSGAGQHPGNQRTRGICALGTAAIVLKGYTDAAHTPLEWLQRALDGVHQEANLAFWRDDGMFIEGPGYSSFTLSIMIPFARYYQRASGKWLFDDPRLRNALLYLVYITQPDSQCAAIGTTNMCNVANSLRLCIGAGDPRDQTLFRWALEQWGSLSGGGVRDLGLFDDSVRPSVAGVPTARFLPVSQEASVRSEWSHRAVALWFKGKDPWLARTHRVYSHGDAGSFVVHAYGELLAVDAGYDHWVSYDLYPPELHNTLLVDGEGPVSETPGLLENAIDAGFVQAGDIVTRVGEVEDRRTFALLDGRWIVIADDIFAAEEHEYQWQIHTPVSRETGEVVIAGSRASWTGFDPRGDAPGEAAMEAVWAGPVELQPMEKSRWQPFSSDPKTGSYDNWALVAKQRAANVRFLTALCPHPSKEGPPQIETPDVEGGRCVVIRDGPVTYTALAPAGGEMSVGGLRSSVRTCVVRESEGKVDWVYATGPGQVAYEGQVLAAVGDTGPVARRITPAEARRPAEEDNMPPAVAGVTLDEEDRGAAEMVDVGRVDPPPRALGVRLTDEGAGLDALSLRVTLDGWLKREGVRLTEDGDGVRVDVDLDEALARTDHELVIAASDRAARPNRAQFTLKFSMRPLLVNGGFERGGKAPLGWGLGAWSRNEETKYEIAGVADRPHSGKWCVMIKGLAGGLNMVVSQAVQLEVGQEYVLSGFHRGEVTTKASLCAPDNSGQYIFSEPLGPSEEWAPFRWEFTCENPAPTLLIGLRSGAVGAAFFDDVALEKKEGP